MAVIQHRDAARRKLMYPVVACRQAPDVARKAATPYVAAMAAAFAKLMTLIALVLMPIGMASASAVASPVDHAAMSQSGHCGDQGEEDQAPGAKRMDCTAACTALPPSLEPVLAPPLKPLAQRTVAVAAPFKDIVLEIATPPPRLS